LYDAKTLGPEPRRLWGQLTSIMECEVVGGEHDGVRLLAWLRSLPRGRRRMPISSRKTVRTLAWNILLTNSFSEMPSLRSGRLPSTMTIVGRIFGVLLDHRQPRGANRVSLQRPRTAAYTGTRTSTNVAAGDDGHHDRESIAGVGSMEARA